MAIVDIIYAKTTIDFIAGMSNRRPAGLMRPIEGLLAARTNDLPFYHNSLADSYLNTYQRTEIKALTSISLESDV